MDLRTERLIDRKQELRRLLAKVALPFPLRYAEHVEDSGTALFQRICELDLEGIVAKHKSGEVQPEQLVLLQDLCECQDKIPPGHDSGRGGYSFKENQFEDDDPYHKMVPLRAMNC